MYQNVGISPDSECRVFDKSGGIWDNFGTSPILMQYTGLKDKNGKEIYEGDVVSSGAGRVKEVVFNQSEFKTSIALKSTTGSLIDIGTNASNEIEVIGNIYEKPELLDNGA